MFVTSQREQKKEMRFQRFNVVLILFSVYVRTNGFMVNLFDLLRDVFWVIVYHIQWE